MYTPACEPQFHHIKVGYKGVYITSKLIKTSKKDVKDELAKKLNSKNISGKDWWKTFKCLIGKDKHSPIPPLNHNGDQINDPSEKANIFNKYFQLQSQLDDKAVPNLTQSPNLLSTIVIHYDEVCSVLKALPVGKACGPDQINNRVLKEVAESIAGPLTHLFNASLAHSTVPNI